MNARFRSLRRAVYALTRKYAQTIYFVQVDNVAVDVQSGVQTADRTQVTISKAVVMPTKDFRKWMHANPDTAFKRDFAFGGSFDLRARAFLINRRAIPSNLVIDLTTQIDFNNVRWQAQIIKEYEEAECIIIIAQELDGSPLVDISAPTNGAAIQPNIQGFAYVLFQVQTTNLTIPASLSGTTYSNFGSTGEVDLTLPPPTNGLTFTFLVEAGQVFKIITPTGFTIRNGGLVSVDGGNLSSNIVGSNIQLVGDGNGSWVALNTKGQWSVN